MILLAKSINLRAPNNPLIHNRLFLYPAEQPSPKVLLLSLRVNINVFNTV
jgi:hypothetical protein